MAGYRIVEALKGISFQLGEGELLGLIGPNGAGKSTTIKILCGILEPTAGECEVGGLVPWRERVSHVARIGAVFGQRTQLWWDLPVVESFELLRDIYRVAPSGYREDERRADRPARPRATAARRRCASSRSASACAARSRPACCTSRACCSSTSRRSGSTRREARGPRFREDAESRARCHGHPHDARHARHRGAGRAGHRDREGV